jgi:hypothetical protein
MFPILPNLLVIHTSKENEESFQMRKSRFVRVLESSVVNNIERCFRVEVQSLLWYVVTQQRVTFASAIQGPRANVGDKFHPIVPQNDGQVSVLHLLVSRHKWKGYVRTILHWTCSLRTRTSCDMRCICACAGIRNFGDQSLTLSMRSWNFPFYLRRCSLYTTSGVVSTPRSTSWRASCGCVCPIHIVVFVHERKILWVLVWYDRTGNRYDRTCCGQ